MTAERWAQVRSVVEAAVALPESDRAAFLARVRAEDASLGDEVEPLMAAAPDAEALLRIEQWQTRASGQPLDEPATEMVGMRVGRYRLLRELGRGGMGAVFLAERADGEFQQLVALKTLQDSFQGAGLAERFRQERQILASLSHPGIARLLDGGVTAAGTPYTVMEYVDGLPIDAFCEAERLDLHGKLRLFLEVARAVQYAHQQLVLHLDLKPANILVTKAGEPRLLDFGIARLVAGLESGKNTADATLRLLTPKYASPEQIAGEPLGVASDVFSLGTLLYRLLTGRLPYPLDDASPLEAARVVREVAPTLPSQAAPRGVREALRGDLDLILLRALRKEPGRRYPTVADFAQDVERYLELKPVRAHRDSVRYRARKFARRNGAMLLTSAGVLLLLGASLAAVVHSALRARQQERVAEARLQDVRALAHSYVFDLEPQLQGIPGTVAVRGFILKNALKYLDAMSKQTGRDLDLDYEIARGYTKMSILQNSSIWQSLGRKHDAQASMDKAVAIVTADYTAHPQDLDVLEHFLYVKANAVRAYEETGDIAAYDRELLRLWDLGQPLLATVGGHAQGVFELGAIAGELATNRIGNGALWNLADPVAGLRWDDRADRLLERLKREYPHDRLVTNAEADLIYGEATRSDGYWQLGKEPQAAAALRHMAAMLDSPEVKANATLAPAQRLGHDYVLAGLILQHRLPEAARLAAASDVTEMREAGNNSRLDLVGSTMLCTKGQLALELGRAAEGTAAMQRGLAGLQALLVQDPEDINAAVQRVHWGLRLGFEPLAPAAVRKAALQSVSASAQAYARQHPEVPSAQVVLARAHGTLALLAREAHDDASATAEIGAARQAIATLRFRVRQTEQANLLASQVDAVASGALDGTAACRQRLGAFHFAMVLTGPQQVAACQAGAGAPVSEGRSA